MLASLYLGKKPGELTAGAEFLAQNPPKWDPACAPMADWPTYCYPIYFTYYGSLTMFQMGGDYWKNWNRSLKEMLLPKQRKDGDFSGSWDVIGGSDDKLAGRVYMTAMSALSLEVYYRYTQLNLDRKY